MDAFLPAESCNESRSSNLHVCRLYSHEFHLSRNFGVLKSIIAAFDLDHSPARHVFEIKRDQSVKRELISDEDKKQTGCL